MAADPLEEWIKSRPASVQALARKFPIGAVIKIDGDVDHYILGYNENDMIIITPIWPGDDYDAALAAKQYICAAHLHSDN